MCIMVSDLSVLDLRHCHYSQSLSSKRTCREGKGEKCSQAFTLMTRAKSSRRPKNIKILGKIIHSPSFFSLAQPTPTLSTSKHP